MKASSLVAADTLQVELDAERPPQYQAPFCRRIAMAPDSEQYAGRAQLLVRFTQQPVSMITASCESVCYEGKRENLNRRS